jgi:hypothetical protein
MTYAQKLRDPRWQKMRLRIMERDGFACRHCGDTRTTLNVHHKYYCWGAAPWEYEEHLLLTLCERCHVALEERVREMSVEMATGRESSTSLVDFAQLLHWDWPPSNEVRRTLGDACRWFTRLMVQSLFMERTRTQADWQKLERARFNVIHHMHRVHTALRDLEVLEDEIPF